MRRDARKWVWFWKEQLACFLVCDHCCCYFRNHSGSDLQTGRWRRVRLDSSRTKTSTAEWNMEKVQYICLGILHLYLFSIGSCICTFVRLVEQCSTSCLSQGTLTQTVCWIWSRFNETATESVYRFDLFLPTRTSRIHKIKSIMSSVIMHHISTIGYWFRRILGTPVPTCCDLRPLYHAKLTVHSQPWRKMGEHEVQHKRTCAWTTMCYALDDEVHGWELPSYATFSA